jgi:hypothetical protein
MENEKPIWNKLNQWKKQNESNEETKKAWKWIMTDNMNNK